MKRNRPKQPVIVVEDAVRLFADLHREGAAKREVWRAREH